MATSTNALFTGSSRFSQDFQQVISRAVAIASLPLNDLNDQKTQVSDQAAALSGIDTKFQTLAAAVAGIGNAFGSASLQAGISDPAKLSVTLGDGAAEGDFAVDIVRAGAYAASLSHASWDGSGGHTFQISLNGMTTDLAPADDSAAGLAAAINANFSGQVRATVVNVGAAAAPDYRISLQGTQWGDLQPDILRDGVSLQDQQVTGQTAKYIVNNSGFTAESATAVLPIATGVTVNLAAGATGAASIVVSRSSSALSNALSNFSNAYNGVVDELNKEHGSGAGALSGSSIVDELSQVLRSISTYGGQAGSISGLRSLGLDLGTDGHFTFDSGTFQSAAQDPASIDAFFGSSGTGGFLKAATDALAFVEDSGSGLLPTAELQTQALSTGLAAKISDEQDRIDQLQTSLEDQMAASDALIASMEQQYNYITGMFQAMQVAAQQYQ